MKDILRKYALNTRHVIIMQISKYWSFKYHFCGFEVLSSQGLLLHGTMILLFSQILEALNVYTIPRITLATNIFTGFILE